MRNLIHLAAIVAVCFVALLVVGCAAPADCDQCTQAESPDAFGASPCAASDCFDDRNAVRRGVETYHGNAIQVGPDAENSGVNVNALHEVKDGNPADEKEKNASPQRGGRPSGQTIDDEPERQGVFSCVRCGRNVVGAGWHELWADDGTSLTCLCERCWQGTTNAQKAAHLRAYIRKAGLRGVQLHYVRSLIEEVERGDH